MRCITVLLMISLVLLSSQGWGDVSVIFSNRYDGCYTVTSESYRADEVSTYFRGEADCEPGGICLSCIGSQGRPGDLFHFLPPHEAKGVLDIFPTVTRHFSGIRVHYQCLQCIGVWAPGHVVVTYGYYALNTTGFGEYEKSYTLPGSPGEFRTFRIAFPRGIYGEPVEVRQVTFISGGFEGVLIRQVDFISP